MFTKTLIGLAVGLSAAVALPTTTAGTKQVRMHVFGEDNCNGPVTFMTVDADTCYEFAPGIKSLRVVHHDESIRYNALNVYSAPDCKSGAVLQPILNDGCSAVVVYKAIKLSIDTPKI
ncbi:hypothetical protein COCC4DRAFT_153068 [Bipolaris maydis ATCC 48331]|uniref:AA1-like domain-containing protein n=2 Tax=Cochliobolus heterostrophus TaxID=5016 RepID=M2UBB4_COCH5|nr:uncharacterized protein COCC4DRAFT_153068 [Bipolaris maydis ATCC 48331]EMD85288.1 hypothetical protein COCHEDRAFT_1119528 [Bipolaris maydis C5]KAH7548643.1 hypothetical protein BM1_10941 [Bipolaris maydis]ENH99531.1 hypothetical protein COCC4DRAFT_153068 [Bipolaris maydis ATCC 48331]KAJ5023975.1 hypothetical protein J3E73DRAFT_194632 [Bipolaris maydis]KAJ5058074.1 hypothetical protein J3E74DRAFT_292139 [Bipolaris maydis]